MLKKLVLSAVSLLLMCAPHYSYTMRTLTLGERRAYKSAAIGGGLFGLGGILYGIAFEADDRNNTLKAWAANAVFAALVTIAVSFSYIWWQEAKRA